MRKILFFLIILKQALWISFVPIWQFPDEQAHFGQVQNYSEKNPLNTAIGNNTSREIVESEKLLGTYRNDAGNNKYTYHPEFNIEYTLSTKGAYEDIINSYPKAYRFETVINEATVYPPLYYKIVSLFYNLVYDSDLITRVFLTRLMNIGIFLSIGYVTWLTAKIIFPTDKQIQKCLVILITFHPMLSFLGAGVNSDNLFILFFSLSFYYGLKLLYTPIRLFDVPFLIFITYLGIITKPMGRLIPLVFAYPLIYRIFSRNKNRSIFIFGGLTSFIIALSWPLLKLFQGLQFLPDLPNLSTLMSRTDVSYLSYFKWTLEHTYREVIPWYWGVFRWLSLTYPRYVHRIINWTLVLSSIGIGLTIIKIIRRRKIIGNVKVFGYLIYTSFFYFLAITTYDYFFRISHGFSFGIQGRYFFPTIISHLALLLMGLLTLVGKQYKDLIVKFITLGMMVLHQYALIFVIGSYYNFSSFTVFFTQASQYKPWFFKAPFLILLVMMYGISLVMFLYKLLAKVNEKIT